MSREKRHRRSDDDDNDDISSIEGDKKAHKSSRKMNRSSNDDDDSLSRERKSKHRRLEDDSDNNKKKNSRDNRDGREGKDGNKRRDKRLRDDDKDDDDYDDNDHSEKDRHRRSKKKKKDREDRSREGDIRRDDKKRKESRKDDKKRSSRSSSNNDKKSSRRERDYDDDKDDNDHDDDKYRNRHRHRSSRRYESEKKHKKTSSKSRRDRRGYGYDDNGSTDDSSARNEKRKKKKKSHRSKKDDHSSADTKRRQMPKPPDKSSLHPMGGPLGRPPDIKIDVKEDYYSYHQEFWVYLYREEGIAFNDLDTEEAHAAFGRFAERYNAGDLEGPYYSRTLPNEVIEESKTTQYAWSFRTTETERKGLEALRDGIRRQTEYSKDVQQPQQPQQPYCKPVSDSINPTVDDPSQVSRKSPEQRLEERRSNKRLKETIRTVEEELRGGARDFREKQLEKKREHAGRIHGASKDKEEGLGGIELTDSAVYGDADEKALFQAALNRERRNKEQCEERRLSRIEELQSKEEERKQGMLKMLGLENLPKGQKIVIPPRKDG